MRMILKNNYNSLNSKDLNFIITGKRLRLSREVLGLSQRMLAVEWKNFNELHPDMPKLPVTHNTIQAWETCGIPNSCPKLGLHDMQAPLKRVCEYFGAKPEWFTSALKDESEFKGNIYEAWQSKYGLNNSSDDSLQTHSENTRSDANVINNDLHSISSLIRMLKTASGIVSDNELDTYLRMFGGYYFGYMNWLRKEKNNFLRRCTIKFLVHIEGIDPVFRIITTKLTTCRYLKETKKEIGENSLWSYKGVMIPFPGTFCFIFESPYYPLHDKGFIFMTVHPGNPGILQGMLMTDQTIPFMKRTGACSRILLKKVDNRLADEIGEYALMDQMGYFEHHELNEVDPENIRNETDDRIGIFSSFLAKSLFN